MLLHVLRSNFAVGIIVSECQHVVGIRSFIFYLAYAWKVFDVTFDDPHGFLRFIVAGQVSYDWRIGFYIVRLVFEFR